VACGMVSESRSLLSAGERLVVSTAAVCVCVCGAKPNSLTPLGSVVLPLSAAALCNEVLCSGLRASARLARD
jgi:hypothetical protein